MSRVRTLAAGRVALAMLMALAFSSGGIAAASSPMVADAAALRAQFGLPADSESVSSLLTSGRDVGSALWGIPMSAEEDSNLDLRGRMTFADAVDHDVLPYLRSLPEYGGVYIDQLNGGSLVVLLAVDAPDVTIEIARRMPRGVRGFHVERVKHTEAELMQAIARARLVWDSLGTPVRLQTVAVDAQGNQLRFAVLLADLEDALARSEQLEEELGVPVTVEATELDHDTACTTRDNCSGPMRAGIWIYKGQVDSVAECTMAFHIVIGTDEHFTTAGHCGYSGSNSWLTRPLGVIGSEPAGGAGTLYRDGGQDIMYVTMADAQASQYIYACCTDILGYAFPIQNETVCASLGKTNAIRCGTVTSTWLSYLSDTPNPDIHVWGGDTSITTIDGDSGSPVYRLNDRNQATAIGVNTTEFGQFARLDTSLDNWGANVVK